MENKKKKNIIIGVIVGIIALAIIVFLLLKGCQSKEYTISFDTNGGNVVESIQVKENGTITKPDDPEREGYEFVGWYYMGELFDFGTKINKNIKLEARWEKALEEISIKNMSVKVGESKTIEVTLKPSGKEVDLIWSSSDNSIVSVDQNGKITAKKAGKVTITVKTRDGKHQASCEITVEEEKKEEEKEESKTSTSSSNSSSSSKNTGTSTRPSGGQQGGGGSSQPSKPQPVKDSYKITIIKLFTQDGSNHQNRFGGATKNGAAFSDYTDIVVNGNYFSPGEQFDSSIAPSTVTLMKNGVTIGTATVVWTQQTVK